jgi:hypothetical protein
MTEKFTETAQFFKSHPLKLKIKPVATRSGIGKAKLGIDKGDHGYHKPERGSHRGQLPGPEQIKISICSISPVHIYSMFQGKPVKAEIGHMQPEVDRICALSVDFTGTVAPDMGCTTIILQ